MSVAGDNPLIFQETEDILYDKRTLALIGTDFLLILHLCVCTRIHASADYPLKLHFSFYLTLFNMVQMSFS